MVKEKDSQDEVVASLQSHKSTLQRFRDRVNELKFDREYKSQADNKLYYSVDFSEIYAYLHYDDPAVRYYGLNLFSSEEEIGKQQHYLALTHLFKSFSKTPLYLLQPYVLEMYSYARTQAHHHRGIKKTLSELISSVKQGLKPDHTKLLQNPEKLSEEEKAELLEVMRADYPKLSIDLLEFERWHTAVQELTTRGQLLKQLLIDGKLSHRTDEILKEFKINDSELARPSMEEEKRVVDAFPPLRGEDQDRQFSRLVDARALLLLRNMNRLLECHNARLVLITRDMKSPKVAERLQDESWFGWTDVKKYFYGIEAIYLDLLLQAMEEETKKIEWLTKADQVLTDMLQSVDKVLEETNVEDSTSVGTEISNVARDLLEQNSQNWNELVGVEFIRTSPALDWLGTDFVTDRVLTAASQTRTGEPAQIKPNESKILKQLVSFVDSNDFQEVAAEGASKLWYDIAGDVFSLSIFGNRLNEVLDQLKTILPSRSDHPELFRKIVANSRSFLNMPTIHFQNKLYQEFIKNFRPWSYKEEEFIDQLGRHLADLFPYGAANAEKPESCLFMAFVLGMFDFWDAAVEIAEYGGEHTKGKRSEFDYFLAYAKYRRVDMHNFPPAEALEHYIQADTDIRAALKANPYDPRYLERRGAIALRYHHTLTRVNKKSSAALPSKEIAGILEARGFLKQAVQRAGDDRKIRVRALNNLAYSYGTNDPPELEEAEECIKQIEVQFDEATNDPDHSLPNIHQWPFVMDTVWYIGAKIAYSRGNVTELRRNRDRLQTALAEANLLEAETKAIEAHLRYIQTWETELAAAVANPA